MKFSANERLSVLGPDLIKMISAGYSENCYDLQVQMENSTLVKYLRDKYSDNFSVNLKDDGMYDIDDFESVFHTYKNSTSFREWGITKEEDGLLLIVAMIFDFVVSKNNVTK